MSLAVYCDTGFPPEAARALREGLAGHRALAPAAVLRSNLAAAAPDAALDEADVAFGQPDVGAVLRAPRLRWVHLTSAGYARFDDDATRAALAARGVALTTSSGVYADPCAEHALAMMLATARRLPASLDDQRGARGWDSAARRGRSFLLRGQTVLTLGFGAIGRRLAELLAPFGPTLYAFRRSAGVGGGASVRELNVSTVEAALGEADHIVNLLPENAGTRGWVDAARLARMRPGAYFYNLGRGATVDQAALVSALERGALAGAYLDVTDPEPLPASHPLWSAPNCYVTPHSAGGRAGEHLALVRHFLENLARFERGEPLRDRVA